MERRTLAGNAYGSAPVAVPVLRSTVGGPHLPPGLLPRPLWGAEKGGRWGGWRESVLATQEGGAQTLVGTGICALCTCCAQTGQPSLLLSFLYPLTSPLLGRVKMLKSFKSGKGAAAAPYYPLVYSGILPCFRAGRLWRFVRARRRARIRAGRVSRGSITASMYPRSAATYGFAKRF